MATVTVRELDDALHARLRVRAAQHGRSMEAEVRAIPADQLPQPEAVSGLGSRMHARFVGLEGDGLELPPRDDMPRAALFE